MSEDSIAAIAMTTSARWCLICADRWEMDGSTFDTSGLSAHVAPERLFRGGPTAAVPGTACAQFAEAPRRAGLWHGRDNTTPTGYLKKTYKRLKGCGTLKRHEYRRIRDCWWCPRQKNLPRTKIYGLSRVLGWHCRGHYQWLIVAQGGSPTTHPLRPAHMKPCIYSIFGGGDPPYGVLPVPDPPLLLVRLALRLARGRSVEPRHRH
jgi:hypothetical protein